MIGHLKDGVSEPVLARASDYRCGVDKDLGDRVAAGIKERK
jgi:catalase